MPRPASITALQTRPERLREASARKLKEVLVPLLVDPDPVVALHARALAGHIDRQTASGRKWTFVMLSPSQNRAVVEHLAATSCMKILAIRLWALLFDNLDRATGMILLTRGEIAGRLDVDPDDVSRIMSELVEFGAISRTKVRVSGQRPNSVQYYLNPHVATHLAGRQRDDAHAATSSVPIDSGATRRRRRRIETVLPVT